MNTSGNRRSVLIISYDFAPISSSGVQRILQFARFLPEYGWKPIILCAAAAGHYAWDETLLDKVMGEDIRIIRTEEKSKSTSRALHVPGRNATRFRTAVQETFYQPEAAIRWRKSAVQKGLEILRDYKIDVIMASAPPFTSLLVARELSAAGDVPYVVDYQDLWVDNPFHFYATPFHKVYNIKLETEILKTTTSILATSRHTKESLLRRYGFLEHNEISIIEHGYDPDDFAQPLSAPNRDRFTITHSGAFPDNRTPQYFLLALKQFLKKYPDRRNHVEARFVGALSKSDCKLIKKYRLETSTRLYGHVPHNEVIRHLNESDVLWLMYKNNVRGSGKLFEYLGARKPLLVSAPDGNIRTIAEGSGAAVITDPTDVAAIVKGLEFFYDLWRSGSLPTPDEEFVQRFDRRILTGDLARVLGLAMKV